MKKVLIIVRDLRIGGVPKSLLSFLQSFVRSEYIMNYDLSLLVLEPKGELLGQVPSQVKILKPSKLLRWMSTRLSVKLFTKFFSVRGLMGEISWLARKKFQLFPGQLNIAQKVWFNWHRAIPAHDDSYDVVVSYQDGESNYYAIDKVTAGKKVLWLHSDYQEQRYDPAFDRRFYESCDAIVTISEKCRSCFLQEFPQLTGKTHVLENITSSDSVLTQGDASVAVEYDQSSATKILSVGRLNWQKGFDIAIDAAKLLRDSGMDFLWLIVGEGSERETLQRKIDANRVSEYFKLIGAKENPYPYIKACDILVQPSRVEGRSIVLDEAKIFCKPIVATNYSTVNDSLKHGKSGWIVDMTPQALSEGIICLINDENLRNNLSSYLRNKPKGNIQELQRYIHVMLEQ